MRLKIYRFQNIRKQTPLLIIFLIQYLSDFENSNHPNIAATKNLNKGSRLDFCRVSVQDVVKEIKKLRA